MKQLFFAKLTTFEWSLIVLGVILLGVAAWALSRPLKKKKKPQQKKPVDEQVLRRQLARPGAPSSSKRPTAHPTVMSRTAVPARAYPPPPPSSSSMAAETAVVTVQPGASPEAQAEKATPLVAVEERIQE